MSELQKNKAAEKKSTIKLETDEQRPLLFNNFILMIASVVLIVVGFILIGGSSSSLEEYNPDIFSVRRIVIGPTLCFLGFVLMAVGIIVKPKDKK